MPRYPVRGAHSVRAPGQNLFGRLIGDNFVTLELTCLLQIILCTAAVAVLGARCLCCMHVLAFFCSLPRAPFGAIIPPPLDEMYKKQSTAVSLENGSVRLYFTSSRHSFIDIYFYPLRYAVILSPCLDVDERVALRRKTQSSATSCLVGSDQFERQCCSSSCSSPGGALSSFLGQHANRHHASCRPHHGPQNQFEPLQVSRNPICAGAYWQ